MLKFHHITDTHYYNCEKLGFSDDKDQVTRNESGAVLDAIFDKLAACGDTDLVLISGDLCNTGDRANSEGFIPKLRDLQRRGKRVFLITASHDYYKADHADDGEDGPRADMVYRDELYDLYYEFGFNRAIARFEPDPLSYVAQLAPGYRLLCLNNDDRGDRTAALCGWAVEQIEKAKSEGQFIFGMHHYPILPPSPIYPLVAPRDMIDPANGVRDRLADAGLRFIFTGHTHMQNITYIDTEAGNRLYEINTGAATGYDAPIRYVTIGDESVTIKTETIDSFDWDLQGKSVSQYLSDSFDRLLNSIFEAANTDVEQMLDIVNSAFRVNKAKLMKHKLMLTLGGKFLYRLTLGGAGRLLLCPGKIHKSVKKVRVKDLLMEIIRNIYQGDEPYSEETPMGAAVYALVGRIERLAKPALKNVRLPFESVQGFVMSLIYDGGLPDNEAVLPLHTHL
ncbi:MAG: metallophosphoesterase [Oscillospiraceae bacterium]|nr:metallophosphoesterase [Oscillospiraceae bacterium]